MKTVEKSDDNRKWALDYVDENTKVIVASQAEDIWKVVITQKSVSDDWDSGEVIELESFKNYETLEIGKNGEIIAALNTKDYSVGSMAVILIVNKTRNEFKPVYVNFSDNGKVIVGSESMKKELEKSLASSNLESEIRRPAGNGLEYSMAHSYFNPPVNDFSSESLDWREVEELVENVNVSWYKTTTADTEFVIYNDNGNPATEYASLHTKSPFRSIKQIVFDSKLNYSVRESTNTSRVVFKYEPSIRTKFYCFQFTNFYGCVGIENVEEWSRGYLYTHVVRCDGYFASNTDPVNITASNQPFSHSYFYQLNDPSIFHQNALEGNSGAYVYKISKLTSKTKATMIVNLSESTLHYSPEQNTTFYSYINAMSNDNGWFVADIGLAMSRTANGNMQLFANPSETSTVEWSAPLDPENPYTIAVFDQYGTTYVANQDIKVYFEVKNGYYHGKVYNYTTNETLQVWIYNSKIRNTNLVFMNGTSLVPVSHVGDQIIIPDIRCGAYAANIPILYPRLYTSSQNWDGNGTEFAPNASSVTSSLIIYDNDHVTHTYTSSNRREVINIDYTNVYEE